MYDTGDENKTDLTKECFGATRSCGFVTLYRTVASATRSSRDPGERACYIVSWLIAYQTAKSIK